MTETVGLLDVKVLHHLQQATDDLFGSWSGTGIRITAIRDERVPFRSRAAARGEVLERVGCLPAGCRCLLGKRIEEQAETIDITSSS